jgi:diguanylate cyclase (GGDEF)-like protein
VELATAEASKKARRKASFGLQKRDLQLLFENMISPFSYYQMMYDENGLPVDFVILAVNSAFELETGFAKAQVFGKRVLEVFPETEQYWIDQCGQVAKTGISSRFSSYSKALDNWYEALVYSPKLGYFAMTVHNVTNIVTSKENLLQTIMEKDMAINRLRESENELLHLNRELQKNNDLLNSLAIKDKLTGLFNRLYIDNRIADELVAAEKQGYQLSLILFDLDHFKDVNDQFGHDIGDEVLTRISTVCKAHLRVTEEIARWGGEEFLVLMPKTVLKDALIVAERLRKAIEKVEHPYAGKVTATFGVAERIPGESLESLFKRVDFSLYKAKSKGRNCVASVEQSNKIPHEHKQLHLQWDNEWEGNTEESKLADIMIG